MRWIHGAWVARVGFSPGSVTGTPRWVKVSGVIVLILLVGVMLRRRNKKEVADFFAALTRTDDIHAFKPREFIEAGEHVTVLGWENSSA